MGRGEGMIRLKKSEALQRLLRQDDLSELGIPTWTLVREAVQKGKTEDAFQFLEYGCTEARTMHDSIVSFVDDSLTYIARFGEEEIYRFLKDKYVPRIKDWLRVTPGVVETMERFTEQQRSHFAEVVLKEEKDRYIMSGLCGSGGRLRKSKSVATTKKAYPWSWNKENVPYYCLHCCVAWEIIPNEIRGYPLRIHLLSNQPDDPCVHLFYKEPQSIPEEYLTRVGMSNRVK